MSAGRQTPRVRLPLPPNEYDPGYMERLVRTLENILDDQDQLGPGRFSTLTLKNIPGNGGSKEQGFVYQEAGTLKIVPPGGILVAPTFVTASLGSVTVTITP